LKFIKVPQIPIPDWEIEGMSHEEDCLKDQEPDLYNPYLYVYELEADDEQNSTAPELDEAELYQPVF